MHFAHSFRVTQPVPLHAVLDVVGYNVALRVGAMWNVHVVALRGYDLLNAAGDAHQLPVDAVPCVGKATTKRSFVVEDFIALTIHRQTLRIHAATVAQNLHVLCRPFDYFEFIFGQGVVLYSIAKLSN